MIRRVVTVIAGIVIALVAILGLWLSRDTTPELPPLRPLTEPNHHYAPIPETTSVPNNGGYVDDSVTDTRDG